MAYIKQVKLPDNTKYDIADKSISTMGDNTSSSIENKNVIANYIASRGENLLTNGTALLGNNYNFTTLTYDGSDTYYAGGSFKKDGWSSYASFTNDEYIPVDVNQKYRFDFYTKTNLTGAQINGMITAFDIDKKQISPYQVAPRANTLTFLTHDLNPGDQIIRVNDLSGWQSTNLSTNNSSILFWGYKNSYGYEYPPETYTTYRYAGLWSQASQMDFVNNTITLNRGWAGPAFAANTKLSQGQDGSGALYCNIDDISITATLTPGDWEYHWYHINGLQTKNSFPTSQFPFGTAFIKVGLMNRPTGAGQNFKISTMSFSMNASAKDIPKVYNATLTIQKNGSTITTFTANSNTNRTANIIVPDPPSPGSMVSAVAVNSSAGSASTFSRSDHVHNITGSTINAALGYTPENSLNKVIAWSSTPSDSNYPSEKLVKDSIDAKSNTYIVSIAGNPVFNDGSPRIYSSTDLVDIEGNTIRLADLKQGDVFYVDEPSVIDRWVSNVETLPTGYTRLQYIEGSGAAYINTGIIITSQDCSLSLDAAWTGSTLGQFESFAGFMDTSTIPRFGIHKYNGVYMYGTNVTASTSAAPVTDQRCILQVINSGTSQYLYKDGSLLSTTSLGSGVLESNTLPLFIFARNASSMNICSMRLYSAQLTANGNVYRYIPCKNSSNEIGVYETTTGTFLKSASSTNFTPGAAQTGISIEFAAIETGAAILPDTAQPVNVGTTSSAGGSSKYSRGDHRHAISLSTGDNPGEIKIAGTNVLVNGLPTTSTDNAIVRFNGTSGAMQSSEVILEDASGVSIGIAPADGKYLNIKGSRLYVQGETHFNSGGSPTDFAYGQGVGIFGKYMMINGMYTDPNNAFRSRTSAMATAGKSATTWSLPYGDSGSAYTLATTSDIPDVSDFITKDVNNLTYYTKTSDLADVALSGNYNDLSNKPTIPTALADLSSDSTHRLVTDTEKTTWNNKQNALTFDNTPTDNSNNPVTSSGIYNAIEDVREVAEGKNNIYVVSDVTNPVFNSQNDSIQTSASITDINGRVITINDLKIGDTIYVNELDVPDRWVCSLAPAVTPTDLTNTTWIFHDRLDGSMITEAVTFNLNYTTDTVDYTQIRWGISYQQWFSPSNPSQIFYCGSDSTYWVDEAYKTITVTGGADATNAALLSFFITNAELQTDQKIATLSKLETAKVPVTDVRVDNTSVVDNNGIANITLPADKYHDNGSWSGLTYTATGHNVGNIVIDLPVGTSHTTIAYGDHTHTGVYQPVGNYLTNIAWDNTNKKLTKTIGSSTSDVVELDPKNPTLAWNTSSVIATLGTVEIKAALPQNPNTDTLQNVSLATTSKAYITGVTTTPTATATAMTAVADTGVYLSTVANRLTSKEFAWQLNGTEKAYTAYNSTDDCIEFNFI